MFKNMRFLQMFMGLTSDTVESVYSFLSDFVYWKQPDKAVMLLRECLKIPFALLVFFYILSPRYFIVLGIWAAALLHSPFFLSLFHVVFEKVTF
jgi:hypothetical protein